MDNEIVNTQELTKYVEVFDACLKAERDLFNLPEFLYKSKEMGRIIGYGYGDQFNTNTSLIGSDPIVNEGLSVPTKSNVEERTAKYIQLKESLTSSNNVNQWLEKSSNFQKAERQLLKKDIASVPFKHQSTHNQDDDPTRYRPLFGPPEEIAFARLHSIPNPNDYSSAPLLLNDILKGVTAKSLLTYKEASANPETFSSPTKSKSEKIKTQAKKLMNELSKTPLITDKTNEKFFRSLEELVITGNKLNHRRNPAYEKYSAARNHQKADREIFINYISLLFFEHFCRYKIISDIKQSSDKYETGIPLRFIRKSTYKRDKSDSQRLFSLTKIDSAVIYADVITHLTGIIDPDINERKVREIISNIKNRQP